MSRLLWPRALPRPIFQSQSVTPDFGVEGTEMDTGWIEERRRYNHVPGVYSFALRVSALQQDVLISFAHKVAGAAFEADLWMPGLSRDGCRRFVCRIASCVQAGEITTGIWRWNISLRIESLDPPDFDQFAFFNHYGDESLRFVNLFDGLANEIIPEHMGAT